MLRSLSNDPATKASGHQFLIDERRSKAEADALAKQQDAEIKKTQVSHLQGMRQQLLDNAKQTSDKAEREKIARDISKIDGHLSKITGANLSGFGNLETSSLPTPPVEKPIIQNAGSRIVSPDGKNVLQEAQFSPSKKTIKTVDSGDSIQVLDNEGNLLRTIKKGVDPKEFIKNKQKEGKAATTVEKKTNSAKFFIDKIINELADKDENGNLIPREEGNDIPLLPGDNKTGIEGSLKANFGGLLRQFGIKVDDQAKDLNTNLQVLATRMIQPLLEEKKVTDTERAAVDRIIGRLDGLTDSQQIISNMQELQSVLDGIGGRVEQEETSTQVDALLNKYAPLN